MPKAKISVTIEQSLVRACDRLAEGSSRSKVIERALTGWLRDRRRHDLEEEIERYYSSLTASEREDHSRWADLSARTLRRSWR